MQTSSTMSEMSEEQSEALDAGKKIKDLENRVKELEATLRNRDSEISNLKADAANLKNVDRTSKERYEGLLERHNELKAEYERVSAAGTVPQNADRGDVIAHANIVCEVAGTNLDPSPLAEAIGGLRDALHGSSVI